MPAAKTTKTSLTPTKPGPALKRTDGKPRSETTLGTSTSATGPSMIKAQRMEDSCGETDSAAESSRKLRPLYGVYDAKASTMEWYVHVHDPGYAGCRCLLA